MAYIRFIATCLILVGCAIQSSPEGGPRDETPPVIVSTTPPNKSTLFNATEIVIEFDEYVQLKNFPGQFFSSPPLKKPINQRLKGKKLYLSLDEELRPNTTYTFSFGTALQDITENNVQAGFKYVFSTGDVLDSLVIDGSAVDAYTGLPISGAVAMLYPYGTPDTSLLKEKPSYYSITDDAGNFVIENLAIDTFQVIVVEDQNLNLTFDPGIEKAAFVTEHVFSGQPILAPLRLYKAKTATRFIEATQIAYGKIRLSFTNPVDSIKVNIAGSENFTNKRPMEFLERDENGDSIYFWYNPEMHPEDINFFFLNIKADTLLVDSSRVLIRKQQAPALKLEVANTSKIAPLDTLLLESKVPLISIDEQKFILTQDSVPVDFKLEQKGLRHLMVVFAKKAGKAYQLQMLAGAAMDLFNRTSDSTVLKLNVATEAEKAILKIRLRGSDSDAKIFELMDDQRNVVKRTFFSDSLVFKMPFVEPGKYGIRIVWDENENRIWDGGNFENRQQPEQVMYYPKAIELRANWELEVDWIIPEKLQ